MSLFCYSCSQRTTWCHLFSGQKISVSIWCWPGWLSVPTLPLSPSAHYYVNGSSSSHPTSESPIINRSHTCCRFRSRLSGRGFWASSQLKRRALGLSMVPCQRPLGGVSGVRLSMCTSLPVFCCLPNSLYGLGKDSFCGIEPGCGQAIGYLFLPSHWGNSLSTGPGAFSSLCREFLTYFHSSAYCSLLRGSAGVIRSVPSWNCSTIIALMVSSSLFAVCHEPFYPSIPPLLTLTASLGGLTLPVWAWGPFSYTLV